MGNWDWQVFLQDPGGKDPTYWQWMLSAWGWTGDDTPPVLHKEPLSYESIEMKARSYK